MFFNNLFIYEIKIHPWTLSWLIEFWVVKVEIISGFSILNESMILWLWRTKSISLKGILLFNFWWYFCKTYVFFWQIMAIYQSLRTLLLPHNINGQNLLKILVCWNKLRTLETLNIIHNIFCWTNWTTQFS